MIHHPIEGIFPRNPKNKDFKYWSLRAVIKKLPLYISHTSPVPWADTFIFKLFGNSVDIKTPLYDGWIDTEFLEIGRGTLIGQGAVIMTSMITTDNLIIKRVKIGKDCLIGAQSVISPGTIIRNRAILGALSNTTVDQELEENWIYFGTPAKKFKKNEYRERDQLSAGERAQRKQYIEETTSLAASKEIGKRKGAKAFIQMRKIGVKERNVVKLQNKAEYAKFKAKYKARKFNLRADRHLMKAEKKKYESLKAMEKAKEVLELKIQKNRDKLSKLEEKEYEKELKSLDKLSLKNVKKDFKKEKKELKKDPNKKDSVMSN